MQVTFLKDAKLKNLHTFITEYKIDISVCEKNKTSILVSFVYE